VLSYFLTKPRPLASSQLRWAAVRPLLGERIPSAGFRNNGRRHEAGLLIVGTARQRTE
jgi:hypothetical protein